MFYDLAQHRTKIRNKYKSKIQSMTQIIKFPLTAMLVWEFSIHLTVLCHVQSLFCSKGGRSFCGVAGRYVHADSCGSSPACHTLSMKKALDPHCGNHGHELWGWTCWQIHEDIMDTSCTSSADHWHSLQTDSLKQHRRTHMSLLFIKLCNHHLCKQLMNSCSVVGNWLLRKSIVIIFILHTIIWLVLCH